MVSFHLWHVTPQTSGVVGRLMSCTWCRRAAVPGGGSSAGTELDFTCAAKMGGEGLSPPPLPLSSMVPQLQRLLSCACLLRLR